MTRKPSVTDTGGTVSFEAVGNSRNYGSSRRRSNLVVLLPLSACIRSERIEHLRHRLQFIEDKQSMTKFWHSMTIGFPIFRNAISCSRQ
jgi:hypothetical protein